MAFPPPALDHDRLGLIQISAFDHGLSFLFERVIHAFRLGQPQAITLQWAQAWYSTRPCPIAGSIPAPA
jgi:hypothetical protein